MTREEYAAAKFQLDQAELKLNEQLKKNNSEIKKLEKEPDKREELAKFKKEEADIKKHLNDIKKQKTKNLDAKKNAEKIVFKEKVMLTLGAAITAVGLYQDTKDLIKPESLTKPSVERIIENKKEQKTKSQLDHERIEKSKGQFEKLADAEGIKNEMEKEKAEKLRQIELQSRNGSKEGGNEQRKNDEEKKQRELEKLRRIEKILENKEMTKGKTL